MYICFSPLQRCNRKKVEAAYHQLLDEGYVKSKEKSGYYVEDFLIDGWTSDMAMGSVEQTNRVVDSQEDSMSLSINLSILY